MLSQALPYQVATYRIGILIATVKEELLSSIGNSGNNSTSNDGTKDNESNSMATKPNQNDDTPNSSDNQKR